MAKRKKKVVSQETLDNSEMMIDKMNDFAARIWAGQSQSLPLVTRTEWIKAAMVKHGFEKYLDDLVLPEPRFKRYM